MGSLGGHTVYEALANSVGLDAELADKLFRAAPGTAQAWQSGAAKPPEEVVEFLRYVCQSCHGECRCGSMGRHLR